MNTAGSAERPRPDDIKVRQFSAAQRTERKKDGGEGRIRTFVGYRRQIYSLLPLATRVPLRLDEALLSRSFPRSGADGQTRTGNLLITNQVLYQLSYIGTAIYLSDRAVIRPADRLRSSLQTPRLWATCARTNAPGLEIETRAAINRIPRCQIAMRETPCFPARRARLAPGAARRPGRADAAPPPGGRLQSARSAGEADSSPKSDPSSRR
jgi:hypothetical protein